MTDSKMVQEFFELTSYSVPSGHESEIRFCLKKKLNALGFTVSEDQSFPETNSGNLYGFLPGSIQGEPLLFVAHMDTVKPCEDKKITLDADGTIHTDGTTILGGDDVTGIVEFLAAVRYLVEQKLPRRGIEVVFTASEEYFVEGAKRLDYSRIRGKEAYILDTDGEIGRGVFAAPTGIRIMADIYGKASHAALAPEDGINAVAIAGLAISKMKLGRIDEDTTANIGIISGGDSGNVVPARCFVEGETRSLCHEKALCHCKHMKQCFMEAARELGGRAEVETTLVYRAWAVSESDTISKRFREACSLAGERAIFEKACGGSDASFLSAHGIRCLVLATGMHEIHSVREYTTVSEMERMTKILVHVMQSRL